MKTNQQYFENYSKLKNVLKDIPQKCDIEDITYNMPPLKYTNLYIDDMKN